MNRNVYIQTAGIFCIGLCEEIPMKQSRNIYKPVQNQTSEYLKTIWIWYLNKIERQRKNPTFKSQNSYYVTLQGKILYHPELQNCFFHA